jgi:hypothetical protein
MATIDGQLWFAGYASSSAAVGVDFVDSDGSHETEDGINSSSSDFYNVKLDTADNLFFGFYVNTSGTGQQSNAPTIYAGSISAGPGAAALSTVQVGNYNAFEDDTNNFAIDTVNHVLYVGIWGQNSANDGIVRVSYNPTTGALDPNAYNNTSGTINNADALLTNASTGDKFTNALDLWVDTSASKLYYVDNDLFPVSGPSTGGFSTSGTNGVYVVSTVGSVGAGTAPTPTLLTSQSQFPVDESQGTIVSFVVDKAKGLIYFATEDVSYNYNATPTTTNNYDTSKDAIWYISLTGGANQTATKLTGATVDFVLGQNGIGGSASSLALDANSQTLYVSDAASSSTNSKILSFSLSANGHSATSAGTVATPSNYEVTGLTFADLPTLTATGTSTKVVQGGSATAVLASTPTLSDADSNETGATVTINNAQTGDVLASTVSVSGIAASFSGSTLTLSGSSSTANYAAVLAGVTFKDTGADSSSGAHPTRSITIQVNDGENGAPSGVNDSTTTLTIDRAPTVSGTSTASYAAGGSAVAVSAGLTTADLDGDSFGAATVQIITGFVSGDVLSATTTGTAITASYNSSTGNLTFSGTDTAAHYQQVLDSVKFSSSASGVATAATYPNAGTRTIGYAVNDGTATSTTVTSTVNIAATSFSDTAANVSADFDALNANTSITAITITDGQPLSLTQTQYNADTRALGLIGGGAHTVKETGITGQIYTSRTLAYDASDRISTSTLYNASNVVVGSSSFVYGTGSAYTVTINAAPAVTGADYSTQIVAYDSSGNLQSSEYDGYTDKAYTSLKTNYVGGVLHDKLFTGYTSGPYASMDVAYDSSGRNSVITTYDGSGNTLTTATYSYGSGGAYSVATTFASGPYSGSTVAYDGSGHLLSNTETGVTGQPYSTIAYTYDSSARVSGYTTSDNQGHTLTTVSYSYGAAGAYTTTTNFTSGAYTSQVLAYNGSGQITSNDFYGYTGAYSHIHLDYSAGAATVETFFNTDGSHTVQALTTGVALTDASVNEAFYLTTGDTLTLSSTSFGQDTIRNYTPGSDNFDISTAVFADYSHFIAAATSDGHGDTLVTYDTNDTLLFVGVTIAQLNNHQSDFHFM